MATPTRPGKGNYRSTEGNSRLIVGAVTGRSRTVTTHSLTNSGRMPPLDAEPAQPTGHEVEEAEL